METLYLEFTPLLFFLLKNVLFYLQDCLVDTLFPTAALIQTCIISCKSEKCAKYFHLG